MTRRHRRHAPRRATAPPRPPLQSLVAPRWVGLSLGAALLGATWSTHGRDPSGIDIIITIGFLLPAVTGSLWGLACALIEWPVLPRWFRWLAVTVPCLTGGALLVLWRALGLI